MSLTKLYKNNHSRKYKERILCLHPEGRGPFTLSREKWQAVLRKSPLAMLLQVLKPHSLHLKHEGGTKSLFFFFNQTLLAVFVCLVDRSFNCFS